MTSKPPMSGTEAREIVETMKRKTSRRSMRQFLKHATEGFGAYRPNLSPEAIAVYRRALADIQE